MSTKRSKCIGMAMILVLMAVLIAGCTTSSPSASPTANTAPALQNVTLKVFAAASLSDAFNETATQYKVLHPNVDIKFQFAGTQQIRTQVEQGAYADVFAAASTSHMNALISEGFVNNSTVRNFTQNKLALIVPLSNPANISSLSDLSKPGIKLVICAPSVPCGSYTQQLLNKTVNNSAYGASFKPAVLKNVVSQETDVNSAVSKVALGEADAAFVYQSDVPASMQDKVKVIALQDSVNVLAVYPIAVLKESKNSAEAQGFESFVLSDSGKAILDKYHFIRLSV